MTIYNESISNMLFDSFIQTNVLNVSKVAGILKYEGQLRSSKICLTALFRKIVCVIIHNGRLKLIFSEYKTF